MPSSLPNYLLTNRKRLALSQEEVAFLLGATGENKGVKVCRDERFAREPSLRMALTYEAIYGKPARELFAGIYEEIEREVAARAKILLHRKDREPDAESARKRQMLADLSGRQSGESANRSSS
jgi:transcriptional regulator with XRE-family HTH domain